MRRYRAIASRVGAVESDASRVQEHGALAQPLDRRRVVRDEDDRAALLLEPRDATEALALERLVADREDLVEEQDVRVQERGDGEAEANGHPRRIGPYRAVDRVLELGEGDDLVEALPDVRAAEPVDRTVQEDVLAPREIGMKPGSELEQRADPSLRANASRCGLDDSGDDAQQRGLSRPVSSDEPDRLAAGNVERHVSKRPDVGRLGLTALDEEILQRSGLTSAYAKPPRDAFDADLAWFHRCDLE